MICTAGWHLFNQIIGAYAIMCTITSLPVETWGAVLTLRCRWSSNCNQTCLRPAPPLRRCLWCSAGARLSQSAGDPAVEMWFMRAFASWHIIRRRHPFEPPPPPSPLWNIHTLPRRRESAHTDVCTSCGLDEIICLGSIWDYRGSLMPLCYCLWKAIPDLTERWFPHILDVSCFVNTNKK